MATRTIANGGGNWFTAATWVEGVVPTSADDVVATGTSGNLFLDANAFCRSMDLTGYVGTLSQTATTLSVGNASGGALKFSTGMTFSRNTGGTITLVSTSNNGGTGWAVDFGGKDVSGVTFNGTGGKWVLQSDISLTTLRLTLSAGTLDTNSKNIAAGEFVSSTGTRTLTPGSSTFTLSDSTPWTISSSTLMTVTANTATVVMTSTSAVTVVGGVVDHNGMSFSKTTTGSLSFGGAAASNGFIIANLTYTCGAVTTDTLVFTNAVIITGTLTLNGNSVVNRLLVTSTSIAVPVTVTCNTTVTGQYVDFRDITAAGTATWNLGSLTGGSGNALGNTGITFTTAAPQYWVGNTGTWAVTANWASTTGGTGGTGRIPLPQDSAVFDTNSFSAGGQTVTVATARLCASVDTSAATHTPTLAFTGGTLSLYGSIDLTSALTSSAVTAVSLAGRGSHTIKGPAVAFPLTIAGTTGTTYTLAADLVMTAALSINSGAFATANFNVTATTISTSTVSAVTFGTSTITMTTTSAVTIWTGTSSLLSAASATFVVGTASINTRTFAGGGLTYGTLQYTVTDSLGALAITSGNVFTSWNIGPARSVTFSSDTRITNPLTASGSDLGYFLPGTAGPSTPHHADFDITGDLDITVHLLANDWTPTNTTNLVAKDATSNFAYRFRVATTGALVLDLSTNGTAFVSSTSSTTLGLTDGTDKWVRVTRRQSDGRIQFFTAPDGSTWTQLGADITGTTTGLFAGTSGLIAGDSAQTATDFNGRLYRVIVQSGIAGSVVADVDFTTWQAAVNTHVDAAATPKTWTVNNVGDGRVFIGASGARLTTNLTDPTGVVWTQQTRADNTYLGYVTPSSTQWLFTPSQSSLNLSGDIDLACHVLATDWTPGSTQYIAAKSGGLADGSWRLRLSTVGKLQFSLTTDGSYTGGTVREATSSVATGITDNTAYWVRATYNHTSGAVNFYTSADGGAWVKLGTTQTITAGAAFASAGNLVLGAGVVQGSDTWAGRVYGMVLRNGIDGPIVANPDYANRTVRTLDRVELSSVVGAGGGNWIATNSINTGTNSGWTFSGRLTVLALLTVFAPVFSPGVVPGPRDVVLPLINAPPAVRSPVVHGPPQGIALQALSVSATVFQPRVAHSVAVQLQKITVSTTVFAPLAHGPTRTVVLPVITVSTSVKLLAILAPGVFLPLINGPTPAVRAPSVVRHVAPGPGGGGTPVAAFITGGFSASGGCIIDLYLNGELSGSWPTPGGLSNFNFDVTNNYDSGAVATFGVRPAAAPNPSVEFVVGASGGLELLVGDDQPILSEYPSGYSGDAPLARLFAVSGMGWEFNRQLLRYDNLAPSGSGGRVTCYFGGAPGDLPEVVVTTPCYDDELLLDNPALMWRFRESGYRTVHDLSGHGRDGTDSIPDAWVASSPSGTPFSAFQGGQPNPAPGVVDSVFPFDSTFEFTTQSSFGAPLVSDFAPAIGDTIVLCLIADTATAVSAPAGWDVHLDTVLSGHRIFMSSKVYAGETSAATVHTLSTASHLITQRRYFNGTVDVATVVTGLSAPAFEVHEGQTLATFWPFVVGTDSCSIFAAPQWTGGSPIDYVAEGVFGNLGLNYLVCPVAGSYPASSPVPTTGVSAAMAVLMTFRPHTPYSWPTHLMGLSPFTTGPGPTMALAQYSFASTPLDFPFPAMEALEFPGTTLLNAASTHDKTIALYEIPEGTAYASLVTSSPAAFRALDVQAVTLAAGYQISAATLNSDQSIGAIGSNSRSVWGAVIGNVAAVLSPGVVATPAAGTYRTSSTLHFALYPGEGSSLSSPSTASAPSFVAVISAVLADGTNADPVIDLSGSPICGALCAHGVNVRDSHYAFPKGTTGIGKGTVTSTSLPSFVGGATFEFVYRTGTVWHHKILSYRPMPSGTANQYLLVTYQDGEIVGYVDALTIALPSAPVQLPLAGSAPSPLAGFAATDDWAALVVYDHGLTMERAFAHIAHLCMHVDRGRSELGGSGVSAGLLVPRTVLRAETSAITAKGSAHRRDQNNAHHAASEVQVSIGSIRRRKDQ